MRVPQADTDARLEECLRQALRATPYPTAAQRAEAWERLRAQAGQQVMLPAVQLPSASRLARLRQRVILPWNLFRSLSAMLLEETAYRRAHSEDTVRAVPFMRTPYVQFQPMW